MCVCVCVCLHAALCFSLSSPAGSYERHAQTGPRSYVSQTCLLSPLLPRLSGAKRLWTALYSLRAAREWAQRRSSCLVLSAVCSTPPSCLFTAREWALLHWTSCSTTSTCFAAAGVQCSSIHSPSVFKNTKRFTSAAYVCTVPAPENHFLMPACKQKPLRLRFPWVAIGRSVFRNQPKPSHPDQPDPKNTF